jgi:hypothetical protein
MKRFVAVMQFQQVAATRHRNRTWPVPVLTSEPNPTYGPAVCCKKIFSSIENHQWKCDREFGESPAAQWRGLGLSHGSLKASPTRRDLSRYPGARFVAFDACCR